MLRRFHIRLGRETRCAPELAALACWALLSACGSAPGRESSEAAGAGSAPEGNGGSPGTSQPGGGGGTSSLGGSGSSAFDPTQTNGGSGSGEANGGSGGSVTPVITPSLTDTELASASGCAGVFNPDQLLTLSLQMDAGDFNQVLSDTTYSVVVPAAMQCGTEPPLTIGVRRKRSGGQRKVGLKLDMNAFAPGQDWYGLKKLSLENGVSEGDTEDGAEVRAYVSEYLAWRLMV